MLGEKWGCTEGRRTLDKWEEKDARGIGRNEERGVRMMITWNEGEELLEGGKEYTG
jgi:hypothetical protein